MPEVALLHVPGQVVVFRVGPTSYGIDIDAVQEILQMLPITAAPGSPAGVLGLADVRKRVVPVFDLHVRFGVSRPADSSETRLILVNVEDTSVAMLVDGVDEVLNVIRDEVQPAATLGRAAAVDYLVGVVRSGEKLLLWVDHSRLVPRAVRAVASAA